MVREPKATVFVTTEEDASRGAPSAAVDGKTGAYIPSVGVDVIDALHYSVLDQPYDADGIDPTILGSHCVVFVYDEMHGGWLFRFPPEVVSMLARLESGSLETVANRWVSIFAFDSPPVGLNAVTEMLKQVVVVARTSEREGKPMFWLAPSC